MPCVRLLVLRIEETKAQLVKNFVHVQWEVGRRDTPGPQPGLCGHPPPHSRTFFPAATVEPRPHWALTRLPHAGLWSGVP